VITIPGRPFFDAHMDSLFKRDLDRLLDTQYHDDAILISPAPILAVPPPHIVPRANLKDFFGRFLDFYGTLHIDSMEDFVALEDSIFFQAVVSSPEAGRWVMGEAWHIVDGKIDRQYGYSHKLD
jgi:hypothetical protein